MEALVSLVMPFRNTAPYLSDCLNSVLDQSYRHWQLIMVNDHSTDQSEQIAREYAQKDSRIEVVQNAGEGIIPALATAYKRASGVFISRMDSDDRMLPHRIQCLVERLQQHGPGHVAVGQVRYFSSQGISDGYAKYEKWINGLTAQGKNYLELYKECVIPSPCWMVYRNDFVQAGGFNSDRYPEDYDLTFRFYQAGLQIIPCGEVLHLWRDYPNRTSRTSEHYAQNFFLDLKLHYFLKLHRNPSRPLVIWGAGNKGKHLASALQKQNHPFLWMCDNPNKIGKKIYEVLMRPFEQIDELNSPQIIITVANPLAQAAILQFLHQRQMRSLNDFFFFC
jgi:glycosyltransferase involved in cell wall biosynthesis